MLLALSLAGAAAAVTPTFQTDIAASYWSEGVRWSARPGLEQPLWDQEGNVLFEHTFARLQAIADITPSYIHFGPELVVSPIAVFEASAHYVIVPYFGTFSSIIGFDDPAAVWDDDTLDAKIDAGERGGGFGTRYGGEATLQGKVGPVIAAVSGAAQAWSVDAADNVEGRYFYEPEADLLIAFDDVVVAGNAILIYDLPLEPERRWLYLGALGSYGHAASTDATSLRLGPLGVLNANEGRWSYLLLVQAQLAHRVFDRLLPPYVAARVRYTFQP